MNLTKEEFRALLESNSPEQWEAECEKIRLSRDGVLPADWEEEVVKSGLMRLKHKRFSNTGIPT